MRKRCTTDLTVAAGRWCHSAGCAAARNSESGTMEKFVINLDDHEIERRALMAHAMKADNDLWAAEAKAWTMLYSDLDAEQQRVYDMLVEQGVIPERM